MMIVQGLTFFRVDERHLWVLLSEPAALPATLVLVNITSRRDGRHPEFDPACVLHPDDHPSFIRHESFVAYRRAELLDRAAWDYESARPAFRLEGVLQKKTIRRILEGADRSRRIEARTKDELRRQGLV